MTRGEASPTEADGFFATDSTEFGRGISFFDAIYGFSATLLIANLDAPPAEAWRSWSALVDAGFFTQLYGFALSFVVIAVFWRANVRITRALRGLDGATVTVNLIAVAMVMLIPFTTQGISDPASNDFALPTVLYALNIVLACLGQIAFAATAHRRGLELRDQDPRIRRAETLAAWIPPIVFGASIPIALAFGAAAGMWTWLILAFVMPAVGHRVATAN